jgi:hypothetical protein
MLNDQLLSSKKTAELLGIQPESLAIGKCRTPQPLPVIKIGSRAKYRLSDLMTYIEQRTENTAGKGLRN